MKTTSILISVLSTLAAASPTLRRQAATPTVTFSLSNDISGANFPITVAADGNAVYFSDAFAGTALEQDGSIVATSGQLTSVGQNVFCIINGETSGPFPLNAWTTFVDFDGTSAAVETDVSDLIIVCEF